MNKINIIAGMKGAGKSSVLEIVNRFGIYTAEINDVWKILENEGFERDDLENNCWNYSVLRNVYEECLSNVSLPIFITGLSRPREIKFLEEKGISYNLIGVYSDRGIRYQRVIERARKDENKLSFEGFIEKDENRLGKSDGFHSNDLEGLLRYKNFKIENNGSFEDLINKVRDMLTKFGYIR